MLANDTLKITFISLLLMTIAQIVLARPTQPLAIKTDDIIDPSEYNGNLSEDTIRKIQICDRDSDTMELCMRCAKVTKVDYLYPMCCVNEDHVKDWCTDYIFYGIQ